MAVQKTVLKGNCKHASKHNEDLSTIRRRHRKPTEEFGELHIVEIGQWHIAKGRQKEPVGDIPVIVNGDFFEIIRSIVGKIPVGQFVQGHFHSLLRGRAGSLLRSFADSYKYAVFF